MKLVTIPENTPLMRAITHLEKLFDEQLPMQATCTNKLCGAIIQLTRRADIHTFKDMGLPTKLEWKCPACDEWNKFRKFEDIRDLFNHSAEGYLGVSYDELLSQIFTPKYPIGDWFVKHTGDIFIGLLIITMTILFGFQLASGV